MPGFLGPAAAGAGGGSGVPPGGPREDGDRGQSSREYLRWQTDLSVAWALPSLPVLQNPEEERAPHKHPRCSPGSERSPSTAQLCDSVSLCWGEEKQC